MHLRLRAKYTIFLVSLIVLGSCLLSGVFVFSFKSILFQHMTASSDAISEDLLAQMRRRGEGITRLLAGNLVNPVYYHDMQAIHELLAATVHSNTRRMGMRLPTVVRSGITIAPGK